MSLRRLPVIREIADWMRYERLHHYPALATFDREAALKRLKLYEREEREACRPWPNLIWGLSVALVLLFAVLQYVMGPPALPFFLTLVPFYLLQYVMHRRLRRRVEAKVAAELSDGRLWNCIECGYDLRASETRCPECGAPVRVTAAPRAAPHSGQVAPSALSGEPRRS